MIEWQKVIHELIPELLLSAEFIDTACGYMYEYLMYELHPQQKFSDAVLQTWQVKHTKE